MKLKPIDAKKIQENTPLASRGKPTINFTEKNILLSKGAEGLLKSLPAHKEYTWGTKNRPAMYLLFAENEEGQLYVTLTTPDDTRGLRFSVAGNSYQANSTSMVAFFREKTKEKPKTFKFLITSNLTESVWFPVITIYKEKAKEK